MTIDSLDPVTVGLLVGAITPILVSIVQQPTWSRQVRTVVGVAVAVLIGLLTSYANGDWRAGEDVLAIIVATIIAAQTAYRNLWVPTGVAPALEAATSPKSQRPVTRADDDTLRSPRMP